MTTSATPLIPTHIHGFKVKLGTGPYPPHDPRPGQRAVYARLYPESAKARERMAYKGKAMILGIQPITPQAAFMSDEDLAETAGMAALMQAARKAREINR